MLVLKKWMSPKKESIQKNVIKNLKTFNSSIVNNKAIDLI